MTLFYLSFADTEKPAGQQWLGGLFIHGDDLKYAIRKAWDAGQNPGGQVASWELGDDAPVKPEYLGRLLNVDELRASGPDARLRNLAGKEV